jgi:hypothetical protein
VLLLRTPAHAQALSKNGKYLGERYVRLLHVPKQEMEEQVRLGTLAIPGAQAKMRQKMMRNAGGYGPMDGAGPYDGGDGNLGGGGPGGHDHLGGGGGGGGYGHLPGGLMGGGGPMGGQQHPGGPHHGGMGLAGLGAHGMHHGGMLPGGMGGMEQPLQMGGNPQG